MGRYERIEFERTGDVALIRLNQPDSLNALSTEMCHELLQAFGEAGETSRAILLGSRGRAFCAGANIAAIDLGDPERDMGARLESVINPLIKTLRDLPVPLVTAVRGAAAGVGCSIALMGDIIVAGKSAYFLQAFCNIGLVPDGGSPYLLSRAIGRVRAMELMMLGERYPADRAYADGLVTRIVDDEAVDETALEIAQRLAGGPTKTFALIRKSAWAALDSDLDAQLNRERQLQRAAGRTRDFVEGVAAFRTKRKPAFKGE